MTPFNHVKVVSASTERERAPYQTWPTPKQKRETLDHIRRSEGNQEL